MITTIITAQRATRDALSTLALIGLADMQVASRNGRNDGPTVTTVTPRRWHTRDAIHAALTRLQTLPGTQAAWMQDSKIHLTRR